jgi:hypothetical protein
MAADVLKQRVAVLFASPIPAALAAKAATTSIPIVFAIGSDPVETELGLQALNSRARQWRMPRWPRMPRYFFDLTNGDSVHAAPRRGSMAARGARAELARATNGHDHSVSGRRRSRCHWSGSR